MRAPAFSALSSLLLILLPAFFGQKVTLDVKRSMVAWVFELLTSWLLSEGDLQNSEEAFFLDGDESFFSGLPSIDNSFLSDVENLV